MCTLEIQELYLSLFWIQGQQGREKKKLARFGGTTFMDLSAAEWLSNLEMEEADQMMMMMMMMRAGDESEPTTDNMLLENTNQMKDKNDDNINGGEEMKIKYELEEIVKSGWRRSVYPSSSSNNYCPENSSGQLISFGSCDDYDMDTSIKPKDSKKMNKKSFSLCSQQHVLAERKRRQIMTHRFLQLSHLIPHLNKTDKASILGDAAKYLKDLEGKVKELEEKTAERRVESVVLAKRMRDVKSLDEINNNSSCSDDESLEIEARVSNKNVLIRIHTQKDEQKGFVQKILNETEKLHLTTLNCSTMPFGDYAINITIIAEMKDDVRMSAKDLAMHLRLALPKLLCPSK